MDILTASTLAVLTIYGPARVIDGDTVVVNQTHVRLKGVDAAEMNTALGKHSKEVMIAIVGTGNKLTCYLTGEKTYKRDVGYCFTEAHVDINQEIIARGAALACPHYDTRYVKFETEEAVTNQQRARYCGTPAPRTKSAPAIPPSLTPPSASPPAWPSTTSTETQPTPEPTPHKPPSISAFLIILLVFCGIMLIVPIMQLSINTMLWLTGGETMSPRQRDAMNGAFVYGMFRGFGGRGRYRRW